jgi:hypothetical protein
MVCGRQQSMVLSVQKPETADVKESLLAMFCAIELRSTVFSWIPAGSWP